jgi:hypothetical protein
MPRLLAAVLRMVGGGGGFTPPQKVLWPPIFPEPLVLVVQSLLTTLILEFSLLFAVILLGDSGTGKPELLHQFCGGSHTLGVDFGTRYVSITFIAFQITSRSSLE